jgi:hypothetical protein
MMLRALAFATLAPLEVSRAAQSVERSSGG